MKSLRTDRICCFEAMEPRRLLAADVSLGAISLGPALEPVDMLPVATAGTADTMSGSIAGKVTMAADATGLEDVVLHLLGETGNVVDHTQPDTAGEYRFANLQPGIYAVLEVQPAGLLDGRALVGSGGGIAFDNNLLGEIVVHAGSELVGYNFRELAADEISESEVVVDRPLVAHSLQTSQDQQTQLTGAAVWLLYGSPASLPQLSPPPVSSAIMASVSNFQPPLPTPALVPAPFAGSLGNAGIKPATGDLNEGELNEGGLDGDSKTSDLFRDGPGQLEFDSNGWLAASNGVVHFADSENAPAADDLNDSGRNDLGDSLWILDRPGNRKLDAEAYDRAFELSGANDELKRKEENAGGKEVESLALQPQA